MAHERVLEQRAADLAETARQLGELDAWMMEAADGIEIALQEAMA